MLQRTDWCNTFRQRAGGRESGGFAERAEGAFDDGGGFRGGGFVCPAGAEGADPFGG